MSVKETIIKILQQTGYDTMTACELAYDKIKELEFELANEPPGTLRKFYCGQCVLTIAKK